VAPARRIAAQSAPPSRKPSHADSLEAGYGARRHSHMEPQPGQQQQPQSSMMYSMRRTSGVEEPPRVAEEYVSYQVCSLRTVLTSFQAIVFFFVFFFFHFVVLKPRYPQLRIFGKCQNLGPSDYFLGELTCSKKKIEGLRVSAQRF
jgi:hypothetical protein